MSYNITNLSDWIDLTNSPPTSGVITLKNNILLEDINSISPLLINRNVIFNGKCKTIFISSNEKGVDDMFEMRTTLFNLQGGSIFNIKIKPSTEENYLFNNTNSGIVCFSDSFGTLVNLYVSGFEIVSERSGAFGGFFGNFQIQSFCTRLKSRVNFKKNNLFFDDLSGGLFGSIQFCKILDCNWIGAFSPEFYDKLRGNFNLNGIGGLIGQINFDESPSIIASSFAKVVDYNDNTILSSFPVNTAGFYYLNADKVHIINSVVYGNLEKENGYIAHAFSIDNTNTKELKFINCYFSGTINNRDSVGTILPALIRAYSIDRGFDNSAYFFENVYSENVSLISEFTLEYDYVSTPELFSNIPINIKNTYAPLACQSANQIIPTLISVNTNDNPNVFSQDVNTNLNFLLSEIPSSWNEFYKLGLGTLPILKAFCDLNIYKEKILTNVDIPQLKINQIIEKSVNVFYESEYYNFIHSGTDFDIYGLRQTLIWGTINIQRNLQLNVDNSGSLPQIIILNSCIINGNNNAITIYSNTHDQFVTNRFICNKSLFIFKGGLIKNLSLISKTPTKSKIIFRGENHGILVEERSQGTIRNCHVLGFELGASRCGSIAGRYYGLYNTITNESFIINCHTDSRIRFHTHDDIETFNNSSSIRTTIRCSGIAYETIGTDIINSSWSGSFDNRFFKDRKQYVPIENNYVISGLVGFSSLTNFDGCYVKVGRMPVSGGGLLYRCFTGDEYNITNSFVDCELERVNNSSASYVSHAIVYETFSNNCKIKCTYHNGKIIDHDIGIGFLSTPSFIGQTSFGNSSSITVENCYITNTNMMNLIYIGDINNSLKVLNVIDSYSKYIEITTAGFTGFDRDILLNLFVINNANPIEELNGLEIPKGWEECYRKAIPYPALKNFSSLIQPFFLPRSKAYYVSHSLDFIL